MLIHSNRGTIQFWFKSISSLVSQSYGNICRAKKSKKNNFKTPGINFKSKNNKKSQNILIFHTNCHVCYRSQLQVSHSTSQKNMYLFGLSYNSIRSIAGLKLSSKVKGKAVPSSKIKVK